MADPGTRPPTSKAIARRAVRGSVSIAASSYAGFALNLAGTAVLARFISPGEFGAYALAQSYIQIALALAAFAFTQGVVQATARLPRLAETALAMTALARLLLLAAAFPVALAVSAWNGALVASIFVQLAVWQLVDALKTALSIPLERDMRFGRIAVVTIGASASGTLIAVAVAIWRPGPTALVVRDFAASGLALLAFGVMARRWGLPLRPAFDREAARLLWRFGKSMYPVRALELVVARLDRPLIGGAVSLEALGLYHQARYLASLPALAVAPGNLRVAVATYSRLRGDHARTARAFGLVQFFVVRVVLPFAVACAVWPGELVTLMFGPRWAGAGDALRILAVFAVAYPALESYRALLTATEQWRGLRVSIVVQGVVLVATFALAAPRYGATGAALAATVSTLAGLVVSRAVTARAVGSPRVAGAVRASLAAAVAVAVGVGVDRLFEVSGFGSLAVGVAATTASFALALWIVDGAALRENVGAVVAELLRRGPSPAPAEPAPPRHAAGGVRE